MATIIGTNGSDVFNYLNGGGNGDVYVGGLGDDTYYVGVGDSVVENANEGTDTVKSSITYTLTANVENLTLIGSAAVNGTGNALNNTLRGNSGANVLAGGAGNDTYYVGVGDTVVENATEGTDLVLSTVSWTLGANLENLTLDGPGAITGTGNELNNILRGSGGAIVLTGGAGNDTYYVGVGGTVVENANEGTDLVVSDASWTLGANVENLTLINGLAINGTGNELNNTLRGGGGANVLTGGAGNDTYYVGVGDMVVENANEGTDLVVSDATWALGANLEYLTLSGTAAINGTGNSLDNRLVGNSAANILDGGLGVDTLVGGTSNDTYLVDNVSDVVTELVNEGTDTVQSSVTYTLTANVENLTLTGTAAINGTGNELNNTLVGNSGANVLTGGAGNDTYYVGAGDTVVENATEGTDLVLSDATWDLGGNLEYLTLTGTGAINGTGNSLNNRLVGNSGANVLAGGAGNDTYYVGVGDTVVENANEGTDLEVSDVSWALGANVENLTLSGTAASTGIGNSLNNILTGNSGANVLIGGAGNDTYYVGAGDTVLENATEGTDVVVSDVSWALGANVENLTLSGTAASTGIGNSLNNILTGNSGANVLIGGAGNDTYYVGAGDTVLENATEGTDVVVSDVSWALGANVENLTLSGTAASTGIGNSLNNTLHGNSAGNILNGGLGADTLVGGTGNDTYLVDNVSDVVTEQVNEGTDLVQSSVTYILTANVEYLTLSGAAAVNGTGNALNNTLRGNSGANVLAGGAGNDTYYVGAGDTVVENATEGTDLVVSEVTWALGANLEYLTLSGTGVIDGTGNSLNNTLRGNSAANMLTGGAGSDTYVVGAGDTVVEAANEGTDLVQSDGSWTLGANVERLTLTGTEAINGTGNSLSNVLTGNSAANVLAGGAGNDTLAGGLGNDTYRVDRGEGQDTIAENDGTAGNSDILLYGATINPLDVVFSRQVNDLRLAIHGLTDAVTIQNWYSAPTTAQVETIQAGNGQTLQSTQVDQLIQAMASFSQQSGLTWDQAIEQQPQNVQTVLAASWQ